MFALSLQKLYYAYNFLKKECFLCNGLIFDTLSYLAQNIFSKFGKT